MCICLVRRNTRRRPRSATASGLHDLDKHDLDKHDMEHRTPDEGGDLPLPIAFESAGDAVDIDLRVTDDVEKSSVTLRLTFEG